MPSAKELAKALAYRGEIRNTPQNSFLGGVANFLAPVSEFADRDKLPGSIPLLGGMSFADLSGLKGAQSLVNDMSYGTPPIRGASLQTAKVDPRVLDLAGVSGAMIPVGKAALREVAKQVQNRTGFARFMPNTRMGVVPEGPSIPQRPKLQVKPPKEDIYSVADANFSMGIPSGNKTVKIGTLQGSMSSAAGDAERVKKLAGQMSADGGYIERLIVDQNGNVIEGQHRLNALRSLGVTDIPVSVIQDASPTYDLLMKSGKLRSEHARQIVRDSADMLKSEGGDVSAVLSGYDLPKGYEQYFMDAVNDLSKPKAKAMSAPDNVGGAMMQRPKTTVPNTRSNYETKQDGPFYRVTPRSYGETQGNAGRNTEAIGQSSNRTANTGRDREAARGVQELQQGGALDRRVVPPPETNKPFQIARQYTKATQGTDFVFPDMPVSSFEKQSAIARVHQLALEGSPEYKAATFAAYQRQMPELVEMTGAKNHDEFMEKAYLQFGKEVDEQFKNLPYKLSFHKNGEGNYANSREMNADLHNNGNLNVYQGGERHDFLNKVDKETGLTQNEKFRADHDVFGHGVFGNEFGPKGEEIGYGIHSQMFSPLARIPMASETRGQNSLVNYSPLNSDLFDHIHTLNRAAYHAKQRKDYAALKVIEAAKKEAYSRFQFAPQKAILLPPEFLDLKYAGGIPDYLASVNRPAKSTTFASPLTHYSNKRDLEFTDPNRYGTGIKGQEAERLAGAGDISNRSYFYLGEPGQVRPEAGLGSNVYRSESANLYNLNKDPLNFTTLAKVSNSTPFNARYNPGVINEGGSLNDIDRLVKLYGYEGLAVPSKSAASMFVPMKLTKPQAIAEALRGRK
jgi:hypothetical protein